MSLRPHPAQLTGSNSSFLSFSLAVTMDLTALQRDSAIGSAKSPGLSIFFIWSSKFWVRMFISRMDTKKQLCEETVLSHVCPPDTGARFWIITRAFLSPFLTKRLGFWSHTWLTVPPWDKKGKHLTKTSGFRPETSDVYSKSKEKGHLELGSPLGQITLFGKYSLSSSLFIHAEMKAQTDKQPEVSPISPILDANPFITGCLEASTVLCSQEWGKSNQEDEEGLKTDNQL